MSTSPPPATKPEEAKGPDDVAKAAPAENDASEAAKAIRGKRVLMVTPEITYLPGGMGNLAQRINAKGGGLADVSASLVNALFDKGADVHVTLPNYRQLFQTDSWALAKDEVEKYRELPDNRIHLAQDRAFFYRSAVYAKVGMDHIIKVALAFQREVIHRIIPEVQPDLIHCNDWMTGLIPAAARRFDIPCLFTVHNIHTEQTTLAEIEDRGIDSAAFWNQLYFHHQPDSYEESREHNPVDLLTSGIFASHYINTVSPTFLDEVAWGRHHFVQAHIQREIANKRFVGCASGILNAPDPSYHPKQDTYLVANYTASNHAKGKAKNKRAFQERTGLALNPSAPLFFWPSRLDPFQKGCQLLADITFQVLSDYDDSGAQIAIVADGDFQRYFHEIASFHGLQDRLAVCDFDEGLARLGYAASEFMLMPSRFEPCGLPQMISGTYGSLPIVHNTGGLHDTVEHLDAQANTGNGFVFDHYGPEGLRWAMDEAMRFTRLDPRIRRAQVARIMRDHAARFTHDVVADQYITLYESLLGQTEGD